jgi:hypothetical protein
MLFGLAQFSITLYSWQSQSMFVKIRFCVCSLLSNSPPPNFSVVMEVMVDTADTVV